jgi:putative membrane protein
MSKIAWALVIAVLVVLLVAIGASLLLPFWGRMFGFGFGYARPGVFGAFGLPFIALRGLGMLLFWGLIIAGVVWLLRGGTQSRPASESAMMPHVETPLEILKRRYANGEITKEQFEEMKNTLGA